MSEPTKQKGTISRSVYLILAALLLAVIIAGVAIFFVIKGEQKKNAELIKKTLGIAQEGGRKGGGGQGSEEGHKIYSSQWAQNAAPFANTTSSSKKPETLNAAESKVSEQKAKSRKSAANAAAGKGRVEEPAGESASGEEAPLTPELQPIDCSKDTAMPMVTPDSAGGVHIGPAHVFLHTNKPCTVYWRFEPDTSWYAWSADTFVIDCTVTLAYKAMDRCGRAMAPRQERYEIRPFGFVPGAPVPTSPECATDTLLPWVYPDPAGGLHYGPVRVFLQTNKPCTVYWHFSRDTAWQTGHGDTLLIDSTTTLFYKAADGCGHTMDQKQSSYVIRPRRSISPCPAGMEPVEVGSKQFCIDRYEWPDHKGAIPLTYVSVYQAMDSCSSAGKRLCTSDEWSLACAGPDTSSYPYGNTYSRHACVTHDTTMRRSGSKPECRAFFGVYDMSGNVAEWTSTPAKRNPRFYNVMGGFWESGPSSGCFNVRYSYYPQNRHNPVGFRCCKDIALSGK